MSDVATPLPFHPPAQGRFTLPAHILASSLIWGVNLAMGFLLPIIARKGLDATKTQTLLMTAAPTTLYILSIFWGTLLVRTRISAYLTIYFVVGCLPYVATYFTQRIEVLIGLHVLACLGGAGWPAVHGELLRRLYTDQQRGRAFGLLTAAGTLVGAGITFGLGRMLTADPSSWHIALPALALTQGVGVLILAILATVSGVERPGELRTATPLLKQAFEPLTHMREVLAADRLFARYEAAFMTYGIGWMICLALIPFIVNDKLKLDYSTISESTHLLFLVALTAMTVPAGMLMTKLGPMRMSAVSFWLYTAYPLLLIFTASADMLKGASLIYGTAAAGVNVCWMLGPVALAGSAEKTPRYVAIHATLVGLRGAVFQALGVFLYWLTGSLTIPLAIGAAGFVWAGYQMWALRKLYEARRLASK